MGLNTILFFLDKLNGCMNFFPETKILWRYSEKDANVVYHWIRVMEFCNQLYVPSSTPRLRHQASFPSLKIIALAPTLLFYVSSSSCPFPCIIFCACPFLACLQFSVSLFFLYAGEFSFIYFLVIPCFLVGYVHSSFKVVIFLLYLSCSSTLFLSLSLLTTYQPTNLPIPTYSTTYLSLSESSIFSMSFSFPLILSLSLPPSPLSHFFSRLSLSLCLFLSFPSPSRFFFVSLSFSASLQSIVSWVYLVKGINTL